MQSRGGAGCGVLQRVRGEAVDVGELEEGYYRECKTELDSKIKRASTS